MAKNKEPEKNMFLSLLKKDKATLIKLGAVFAVGLFLLIYAGNAFGATPGQQQDGGPKASESVVMQGGDQLQTALESILSGIRGAGQVRVFVTYESAGISEYAVTESTTERTQSERDGEGITKDSHETTKNSSLATSGSNNQPVLITEHSPKVMGVLVIAKGAADMEVKTQLFLAVEALLGLPAHRIVIAESK